MKRKIALNEFFNLGIILSAVLFTLAFFSFKADNTGTAVFFAVFGVICMGGSLILMPVYYLFDADGVTLRYLFLTDERYLWKKIRKITVEQDSKTKRLFFFDTYFKIVGECETGKKTYMNGEIRKTFRTKRLLEEYWDGTVTGYFFDKKRAKSKAPITDEIVRLEREARKKMRPLLSPFEARAHQYGYILSYEFVYETEEAEEYNSRPDGDYTYSAIINIKREGEPKEKEVSLCGIELLYVRLGKNAYRGVENNKTDEHLKDVEFYLDEVFREGIEVYRT